MAKKVKVKLDTWGGMGAFLTGPEVEAMVGGEAARVARVAGKGFEADTWIDFMPRRSARGNVNPPRIVGGVTATSIEARVRNARDNTLIRALGGQGPDPMKEMVTYTRKDGTTRKATRAQAENWMRQRKGA